MEKTETAKTSDIWKIVIVVLVCLTGLFVFLVAIASSGMDMMDMEGNNPALSQPHTKNQAAAAPEEGQGPAQFLKDFEFVPGSAVLVDDHHVMAMYRNPEKEFYAVVLFNAQCDRTGCTPTELIAFSIVDNQGRDVELAKNPAARSPRIGNDI
ncbi:MAG TPA: hypothetical protein VGA73_10315 [Candidatus Binatia bacterium]